MDSALHVFICIRALDFEGVDLSAFYGESLQGIR
jgi:hypothetical protein